MIECKSMEHADAFARLISEAARHTDMVHAVVNKAIIKITHFSLHN